ncbi:MAG: translation elongation factor 4 [Dehalococcoidales bacterium]|nr:translation elongation factor 4 [Dehalococcoidales bacterium]
MNQNLIRNFCIIAHIDHGKSTLADRLIDIAGTMKRSKVTEQVMDSMELERERGITIKAKAVRLDYKNRAGEHFRLNLIDTPGHVDFSYEVSRTLVACEGAVLVIDATQGIQAQTLANIYIAMEHNLVVIPVINKTDLPGSEPERVMEEIKSVLGYNLSETFFISAKTGQGVGELVEAIVDRIPPPGGDLNLPTRALIFDSHYDDYKGVIAYVRVVDGRLEKGSKVRLMGEGTQMEVLELGYFAPDPTPAESLQAGEVGYIATGLKSVAECRVGDTVTVVSGGATEPLIGYDLPKPMVYAGIYPTQADDYADLREAIEKLNLNDASLTFEPEASPILGQGFRCGFLGLLHLDIVVERLEREFGLSLVVTIPGVKFMVTKTSGEISDVTSPVDFPDPSEIAKIEEPWVRISVVTPSNFIGALMEVMQEFEGVYKHTEYLGQFTALGETGQRVQLEYEMPLRSMLTTFYDYLKSRSRGYASLDHELLGYREAKLVKLDVLVNDVKVDAFSRIIPPEKAHDIGKAVVSKLKDSIPRQLFKVPLQAAIGGRIVAREDISARRKDVLSKCYGGDITRKRKLLEKQKEGKKKMKMIGKVEVPKEAFLSIMKLG